MNIYDFDGTLFPGDSTAAFCIYAYRKNPALLRFLPRQGWAFARYLLKMTDKTAMKEQLYSFFRAIDAEALAEEFWERNEKKIFPFYLAQQKETDIIISASPEFLLRPICRRLGIRRLIASRVDSKTGKTEGKNCWGPEKVTRLWETCQVEHCDEFYSDSRSDLPLARLADRAFLVDKQKGTLTPWDTGKQ